MDVRGIRKRLGMTQLEMSMELSISRAQLSMAESKRRALPLDALLKLQSMIDRLLVLEREAERETHHKNEVYINWLRQHRVALRAKIKRLKAVLRKATAKQRSMRMARQGRGWQAAKFNPAHGSLHLLQLQFKLEALERELALVEERLG